MLHTQNEALVHGGILALSTLVGDEILTDHHLPLLVQKLFPEILVIFTSSSFSEQV